MVAHVRIGMSDLALSWVRAVGELLEVIEDADEALLEDAIRDSAANVRRIMRGSAETGAE